MSAIGICKPVIVSMWLKLHTRVRGVIRSCTSCQYLRFISYGAGMGI